MSRRHVRFAVAALFALVLALSAPGHAAGATVPAANLVALTFDDGPSAHTSDILSTLRSRGAPATFFMIGARVQERPTVAAEVAASGCEVGNHSMLHDHYLWWSRTDYANDLAQAQSVLAEVTGRTPRWYKPPYMEWRGSYDKMLRKLGLGLCWPDCAPDDWAGSMSAEQIADAVCADVRPGTVIGLHDGSPDGMGDRAATAESVALIVDRLRAAGYTFVTLDQLPDASPGR